MKTMNTPRLPKGWTPVEPGWYAKMGVSVHRYGTKQRWWVKFKGIKIGPFQTALRAIEEAEKL